MENAAKALLIAAGILIVIMILTLVMGLWNQISTYYTEKHNTKMLEQTVEFNSKFDNYNGKTIRGNELISIINRIIDYNNFQSDMVGYERIKISIDLLGHAEDLTYDNTELLFTDVVSNTSNDVAIKRISELSATITSASSGIRGMTDLKLQKLVSEIHNIALVNPDSEAKKDRAEKLTKILGYTISETDNVDNIVKATKQYYQLTQFKRAMFKCTNISYNQTNGRVNEMTFVIQENADGSVEFE